MANEKPSVHKKKIPKGTKQFPWCHIEASKDYPSHYIKITPHRVWKVEEPPEGVIVEVHV